MLVLFRPRTTLRGLQRITEKIFEPNEAPCTNSHIYTFSLPVYFFDVQQIIEHSSGGELIPILLSTTQKKYKKNKKSDLCSDPPPFQWLVTVQKAIWGPESKDFLFISILGTEVGESGLTVDSKLPQRGEEQFGKRLHWLFHVFS